MSPEEIVASLAAANTITPSGNVMLGDEYPIVPLNSVVKNIKDLEGVAVRPGIYPTVFLRDVAEVVDGSDIVTSYALVNGRRTVYIPVTLDSGRLEVFIGYRVHHSLVRGPCKGGVRFAPTSLWR